MKYFIGIDGGGTHTRAVVLNEMLQIVGQGESGPSNHYVAGQEAAAINCLNAAQIAISNAARTEPGLRIDHIASWGFGLAGVRRQNDALRMRGELQSIMSGVPFVLDHDAAAAHTGAFAGGPGIVLSGGTGAICFGIDEFGERFFADGWGPVLGDEGGGYWIGQEALKAVCRAADGRGPRTRLTSPILSELNCKDPDELVRLVYSEGFPREKVAALARIVLLTAASGGTVAATIRERAVAHLGNSVVAVTRQMLTRSRERTGYNAPVPQEISIVLLGGLFEDDFLRASVGYSIGERLVDLKRDYWPISSWRIAKPKFEAAVGASILARKALES